ncbi:MAG: ABC transporter permease [Azospirillaceae bacterium]|nr:ABC transporter permease [Azospirillaceae bacterium]
MIVLPPFLRRHLMFTLLNLAGLAAGIAGFLLVSLYVAGELSVDRGFTGADRLYRVGSTLSVGGNVIVHGATTPQLAGTLPQDFPEVEALTRVAEDEVELQDGARGFQTSLLWADPNMLRVLDYPLARGDAATALARPDGLVLSPALARTLFGDADPMGRTLRVKGGAVLTVTGLLAPLPETHLSFAAIAADAARGAQDWAHHAGDEWAMIGDTAVYIRLTPGTSAQGVQARLADFVKRRAVLTSLPEDIRAGFLTLRLDPVPDIHLHIKTFNQAKPGGDVGTVGILAAAALLILGVAIANYTNMATAQAIGRAREVGLRKLVGARRRELVVLFTAESVALAAVGTLLALAVVEVCLPAFQGLVGRPLSPAMLYHGGLLPLLLATPLLVGALGGFYPALVLSGYRPAEVLKGPAGVPSSGRLRAVLVGAQFAISIALAIATLTVQRQVDHARGAGLGYAAENLYVVGQLPHDANRAATLKAELARLPGVRAATLANLAPADISQFMEKVTVPSGTHGATAGDVYMPSYGADGDFAATYGLTVLAGTARPDGWNPDGNKDRRYILLTETAARRLGYAHPADAVGDRLIGEDATLEVAGVLADIRFRSARDADEALMFTLGHGGGLLTVRLASGDQPSTVAAINTLVDRLYPEAEHLQRGFADDRIEAMYRTEERQAKVFALFGGLAIALANLGLFGLTALAAARRTKEIGLRRVVGARVRDIVWLMAWQFARPVLLANLVAWPLAWWGLHRWLGQYAVRIDQDPATFLAVGGTALAVALATVAVHVARVAHASPVTALRYE